LGRRVAEHFAAPQDIEWAFDAGELYILQSRPITTLKNTDTIQHILDSVRGDLRVKTAQARGPWVMHNLAETLPHPTPLTWSVIQRFMSGAGALGAMYRLAGFNPAAAVNQDGFLVRIAGRLYMDTAIAPEMFFDNFPFRYDVEELKRRPDAAQAPPTRLSGSAIARWRAAKRMAAANKQLHRLAETFDQELREAHFPAMRRYVESAQRTELISLTAEQIISLWQQHEQEVLLHFGAYSLLPSLICAMALAELTEFLREHFWDQDAVSLAQHISAGGNINSTLDADAELQEVAAGTRTLDEWIEKHGHRAAGEFDLATPRWRENLQAAREMAAQLADRESTLVRHARISEEIALQVAQLQQKLPRSGRPKFAALLDRARRYLGFREDAKDALMLGYDLLRRLALDAGRRLEIGDDVFYLSREDLFEALRIGYAPFHLIAQQKREYEIEGCIELPFLIDASAIDLIGEPATVESTEAELAALSISPGHATGPAQILRRPSDAGALKPGYVLVAPSTDPAWTPLFINAAAIVLECGGVLSHGAIVARELGIPAVVLPNATKRFQSGEHIYVDGSRGVVNCVAQRAAPVDPVAPRNTDTRIPCPCVPPPPGSKDRQAARLRNGFGLAWTVFLVGFFLLPETWVRRPALFLFDTMLWPMVRAWGKPAAVMVVAAAMALLTMMIQKFVTDNRRLREAKRRAKQLEAQAALVPAESPRRRAMLDCCAPLPARTLAAAMAPIGILLGPIVISFVWLGERMAPAAWNVPPNSAVQVVATIDGDWSQPVQISPPANFVVDEATPPVRTLPPLRKTLEHVLQLYHHSAAPAGAPWELDAVPNLDREQIVTDLQSYLASKMPDQGITWLLRPTGGVSGRMPIELTTPGQPALTIEMVLGDENPPAPTRIFGPSIGPIKAIHLVYAKPRVGQFFWQPFASLAKFSNVPFAANLSVLEPNWLWLYLLVYIPTMLVARRGLGVA
jgi:pyruvate,water dikinase